MDNKAEKRMQKIEDKNPKPGFKIMHIGELLDTEFPDTEWLIDKLIPSECITILSGAPASFKTWLFLQMVVNIAEGKKFLERFQTAKTSVLIINEEDHLRLLQERLNALGANKGMPVHLMSQGGFLVENENFIAEILKFCKDKKIGVIFFDSLVRISDASENDAKEMSQVFKKLRKFCQAGITVVITHHERKEGFVKRSPTGSLRGSSDILAAIDSLLSVQRDKNDKFKLKFEQGKNRFAQEIDYFLIRVVKEAEKTSFRIEDGLFDEKEADVHEAIIEVLSEEKKGLSKKRIVEIIRVGISVSENKVKKILKSMIEDGEVITERGFKKEQKCFLAETAEDDQPP